MYDCSIELSTGRVFQIDFDDCYNPLDCDRLGTIITTNNRYWVGDEIRDNYDDADEYLKDIVENGGIVLPIMAYIHSGIRLWIDEAKQPVSTFDSGCIGYIYLDGEDVKQQCEKYNRTFEDIKRTLINEINEFDDYFVWGAFYFNLIDQDGDVIDSCGGFPHHGSDLETVNEMILNSYSLTENEIQEIRDYF